MKTGRQAGALNKFVEEEADASTMPDENGNCPEGFELSADGAKCIKKSAPTESRSNIFDIGHFSPQFVIEKTIQVETYDKMTIQFDKDEEVELVEDKNGDLQIGSSRNVLVINSANVLREFMDCVTHTGDIEYEEKEVSISDAIKSNMPIRKVAEEILRQYPKAKGSLSNLSEQGQGCLKIRARRKVRQIRSAAAKSEHVRNESFYKSSPLKAMPKPTSIKKIKTIRTSGFGK